MHLPLLGSVAPLLSVVWDPQIKGVLFVLIAVAILPGSVYLVLATDTGARLGFLLAVTGLMGWMAIMGVIWAVYGIGRHGPAPAWVVQPASPFQGPVSRAPSPSPALADFPLGWHQLAPDSPQASEALAAAGTALAPPAGSTGGLFKKSTDYRVARVFDKGGERYGPLGLDFRPFNVFHKPHFVLVQVTPLCTVSSTHCFLDSGVPGQPPPKPGPDPTRPEASVLMERNLGAFRLPGVLVGGFSTLTFLLLCWVLHVRDKEIWAERAAAGAGAGGPAVRTT
ncbi:MAG: hypothetical protein ACYDAD_09705 [Acidimicrobiales bacterium]